MTNVTVVIPIGPGHADIARRAMASVEAQTEHCDLLAVYDTERRGPGWARNRGLAKAHTPFVVFLDADDWLESAFVERTLAARTPQHYIFTDWFEDGILRLAPDKPWCGGAWHVITSLIPTDWARAVGGFDERLPGAEDTDFYLKLTTGNGGLEGRMCGQRLAEPLVNYSAHGLRSHDLEANGKQAVMAEIQRRYAGKMGCCGDSAIELPAAGDKLPSDVLAVAMWGGNQRVLGRATGRMYPRTGNGKLVWVDPKDLGTMPDKFRAAPSEPTVDAPQERVLQTTADLGAVMMAAAQRPVLSPCLSPVDPAQPADVRPDVARVLQLGKK